MIKNIFYKKNENCYFKINDSLKRISKIENNQVSYLDYETYVEEIKSYKNIKMNQWKYAENSFFISRHFEWEYNGVKYTTTDKPIKWEKDELFGDVATLFHNGKIWRVVYSGNYYPRVFLTKVKFVTPTREVLFEKDLSKTKKFLNKKNSQPMISKWTDIKYCRNFEKIN